MFNRTNLGFPKKQIFGETWVCVVHVKAAEITNGDTPKRKKQSFITQQEEVRSSNSTRLFLLGLVQLQR